MLVDWQYVNAMARGIGQTGESYTQFEHCDISGDAAGSHPVRTSGNPTVFDWCYIHDQADNDWSGGCNYHHDGIGPDSDGPETWINVTNCTFATLGVTNALAFRGAPGCNNCTVTGNYFTGWALAISLSTAGPRGLQRHLHGQRVLRRGAVHLRPHVLQLVLGQRRHPSDGEHADAVARQPVDLAPATGQPNGSRPTGSGGSIPWNSTWQGQYWWPSDNDPHASDYTG